MEKEDNKLARALQEKLIQCCIDFINENGDHFIDRVIFTADNLQHSAVEKSWQPCTDSTCELQIWDEDNGYETFSFSA